MVVSENLRVSFKSQEEVTITLTLLTPQQVFGCDVMVKALQLGGFVEGAALSQRHQCVKGPGQ